MKSFSGFWNGARNVPGFIEANHYTNSPANALSLCFDEDTFNARLDYVWVIAPRDDSITVIPEAVSVFKFLGQDLKDFCPEGPKLLLSSNEKSDHWGLEVELKFFRD